MKYCEKINLDIDVSWIKQRDLSLYYVFQKCQKIQEQLTPNARVVPSWLYTFNVDDSLKLLLSLPDELINLDEPLLNYVEIKNMGNLDAIFPPHVDIGRKSAILIYINTNEEETIFFEGNKRVEGYIAKSGEAWIMDASQVHMVTTKPNTARSLVMISYKNAEYENLVKACRGAKLCQ